MQRWGRTYTIKEGDTPEKVAGKVAGLMRALARRHAPDSVRDVDREGYNAAKALITKANLVAGKTVMASIDSDGNVAVTYGGR